MRLDFRARLLASSLLLGIAGPAWAQTADTTPAEPAAPASAVAPDAAGQAEPADGDTIVVTGSRLGGESLRQASPISVVSAKEIALSGQINVESVLKDLPQLIPSTTAASNNPGVASRPRICAGSGRRARSCSSTTAGTSRMIRTRSSI
ncbi:hypothetical protein QP179_16875 [Sphingomonas aurantiaca]|uniref:hypothetical protein n=1 Tax=Sphingomonas aurantiaca TaxID=185949 RepID=UPI002FDFFC8B